MSDLAELDKPDPNQDLGQPVGDLFEVRVRPVPRRPGVGGRWSVTLQAAGDAEQEAEAGTVALRRLGVEAQEVVALHEAVRRLAAEATPPDLLPADETTAQLA